MTVENYPVPVHASGKARIVFWTGLLAMLAFFTVVLWPVAFILALVSVCTVSSALSEIRQSNGLLTGKKMIQIWATISGIILGIQAMTMWGFFTSL